MNRALHAWGCRCGTRNGPALPVCRACGAPQHTGTAIWADGEPVVRYPAARPASASPFAAWWWVAAVIFAAFFFAAQSKFPTHDPAKNAAALANYTAFVQQAADVSHGVIVSIGQTELDSPVVTVSDLWYQTPKYQLERLTEALGRRWEECRSSAGLDPNGTVYIRDTTGRDVAKYSPFGGAHVN